MPKTIDITAENFTSVFAAAGVAPTAQAQPKPAAPAASSGKFDLQTFIAKHFSDAREEPYNGGRKFCLQVLLYDFAFIAE